MQCYTDVKTLLETYGSDDDKIDIYCFCDHSRTKIDIEFTFAVDPVVPISKRQLDFISLTCTQKSQIQKLRKDLSKSEQKLILNCQYINPKNYENIKKIS